jgi:sirohydrochlorin cobaltochelatase
MNLFPELHNAALVIAGHGSTLNPDSSAPTHDHASALRKRGIFREVVSCFWKEEPGFREVLHMVESTNIFVVPNFISEGYFTQTVIPRELELEGAVTRRGGRTLFYCDPVGSHPGMTDVLLHRARETAPELDPAQTSLFIVGHGTSLNDNSAKAAKYQVRRISEMNLYGEVLAAYMEEPPLISDWHKLSHFPNCLVVPFFISDGLHSYEDIPVLLGIESETGKAASQQEIFRQNPYHLHGKTLFYASAIGTEPMIADVILDQVEAMRQRLVRVNGEWIALPATASPLPDLLDALRIPHPTALVEHNGRALLRHEWADTHVRGGDVLEILRISAGG